jgi:hypothetical protein
MTDVNARLIPTLNPQSFRRPAIGKKMRWKVFSLFCVICVFNIGCRQRYQTAQVKIVGGEEFATSQCSKDLSCSKAVRSTAMITSGSNANIFCSGTLIHPQLILTAAHCFKGKVDESSDPFLEVSFVDNTAQLHSVFSLRPSIKVVRILKGQFNSASFENDYALLVLESAVPAVIAVPAKIPTLAQEKEFLKADAELLLAGYGVDSIGGESGTKRIAVTRIAKVLSSEFASVEDAPDTCKGDSGGPAFIFDLKQNWYIAGITSRSSKIPDQCNGAGLYVRTSPISCWILQKTGFELGDASTACERDQLPVESINDRYLISNNALESNVWETPFSYRGIFEYQEQPLPFEDARKACELKGMKFPDSLITMELLRGAIGGSTFPEKFGHLLEKDTLIWSHNHSNFEKKYRALSWRTKKIIPATPEQILPYFCWR